MNSANHLILRLQFQKPCIFLHSSSLHCPTRTLPLVLSHSLFLLLSDNVPLYAADGNRYRTENRRARRSKPLYKNNERFAAARARRLWPREAIGGVEEGIAEVWRKGKADGRASRTSQQYERLCTNLRARAKLSHRCTRRCSSLIFPSSIISRFCFAWPSSEVELARRHSHRKPCANISRKLCEKIRNKNICEICLVVLSKHSVVCEIFGSEYWVSVLFQIGR